MQFEAEVSIATKVYKYTPQEQTELLTKKCAKYESSNNMEFAIINTGGKQYQVSKGDVVKIEKIKGDFKVGDKIVFDKVMLVDDGKNTTIGTPYIEKAKVEATLKEIGRNKTVEVVKYKQKSRYYKKNGHRQPFFRVEIGAIK